MKDKALQVGIISGIISSVIVLLFIQPLLTFGWYVIIRIGTRLHQGYVDAIYRNAARGDRDLNSHLILMLLALACLAIVAISLSKETTYRWLDAGSKFMHGLLLTVLSVFVLVALILQSVTFGIMELNASFNQHLTILAPSLSDADYKSFRARWASMQTKADYDLLVSDIESTAKSLGLKLPHRPSI